MKNFLFFSHLNFQKIFLLFFFFFFIACDPEGKNQCAWVLEPEPDIKQNVDQGFIPVCARNRSTKKQDCRLQTTLDKAKEYFGRKFRYSDLKVKDYGIPRTITEITFCD